MPIYQRIYLLGAEPEEKLEETMITIVNKQALELILLLHFYQIVDILLCGLGPPQSNVVADHSISSESYLRYMWR